MRWTETSSRVCVPLVVLVVGVGGCSSSGSRSTVGDVTPNHGVTLPPRYRDWSLVTIAREQGRLDDIRAVLGNEAALRSFRSARRPFPDGTIIVRIAWSYESAPEDDKVLGDSVSHVAGIPKNGVQVMVKDSRRFASTGGWGFAQFNNGRPAAETVQATCQPCHAAARHRDFVFSRYAP